MTTPRQRYAGQAFLLTAAVVWGFGFVAQRTGSRHLGPFTFNALRYTLGMLAVLPAALWPRGRGRSNPSGAVSPALPGAALRAGTVLFLASALQQVGMAHTSAGKGAFITGLYVVLVPVFGLALGKHIRGAACIGAALAGVGLYFLSVTESLTLAPGDGPVLLGAAAWAVHVLIISSLASRVDPIRLACSQFGVCAVLSAIPALLFETTALAGIRDAAVPLLYGGVVSVGVGFTLQVLGQRHTAPTPAAIILTLESVFGALAGYILLDESFSGRAALGCVLMLAGMLAAQWPESAPAASPTSAAEPAGK